MYRDASLPEQAFYLGSCIIKANDLFNQFKLPGRRSELISLALAAGVIHLVCLIERVLHGEKIYNTSKL